MKYQPFDFEEQHWKYCPPITFYDPLTSQGDSLRAPPPSFPHCNGHINNINMIDVDNKKSAVDVSNELNRRVMELGKERSVEPESSMGHLQVEKNSKNTQIQNLSVRVWSQRSQWDLQVQMNSPLLQNTNHNICCSMIWMFQSVSECLGVSGSVFQHCWSLIDDWW